LLLCRTSLMVKMYAFMDILWVPKLSLVIWVAWS
jgi:hypothetical protein